MHDINDFEIFETPGCMFLICKMMYGNMTKTEIYDDCCNDLSPDQVKTLIFRLGQMKMIRPILVKRKPGLAFELTDHGCKLALICDVLGNILFNDSSTDEITGMIPGKE